MSTKIKNVGPAPSLNIDLGNGQSLTLGPREVSRPLTDVEFRSAAVQRHLNQTKYVRLYTK